MTKVYFPNCFGLRFVASLFVICYHIEQVKGIFNMPNHFKNFFLSAMGNLSITSFYVLSGFLITYLLMQEKKETGSVDLKKFYIRRALRIWPLYYLVIGLSLFVFPHIDYFYLPNLTEKLHNDFGVKTLLYMLALPNVVIILYGIVPFASQSWSIGVEEQCYVLWPLILKRFRQPHKVLVSVIGIYLAVKFGLMALTKAGFVSAGLTHFASFWGTFSIDCIAIGGLAAWIVFEKKTRVLSVVFSRYTQIALYGLMAFLLIGGYTVYKPLFFEFYAVLFAVVILNLAANKRSILSLENRLFSYMGKISYGLYMYHAIAIVVVIRLVMTYAPGNTFLLYAGSFAVTFVLAIASYELFEKRFLQKKKIYSKVISGETVEFPLDSVPSQNDRVVQSRVITKPVAPANP
ncbi:acyltransferase family protein [Flavisolibacter nicotianae]|uniref:acyltransferase family protein n=1 Tax=Flavisolibacter nicotianae TaxID=2364882 RepID=UPI000EB1E47C|nr:acyltransferase [Flavisolibacter nicotianae]